MGTLPPQEPSHRAIAMLRAVAAGSAELSWGSEPDLFVDGLPCDYVTAHELAHSGLIRRHHPALARHRAPAELTEAGRSTLAAAHAA